ncbi:MAG: UDP-N-acetylmuramoyl-L-alanine--D-glutamate ligase [Arenicellaceae bacterium]|nr:UDP-N-acetylmuramoyl-L-alanine--D-glutamate ligase [Arenicellaceae bacterium]
MNTINSTRFSDTHALVVGLGLTGMSAVRYLRARGASVSVVDTRATPPAIDRLTSMYPEVSCITGSNKLSVGSADMLVVSPGLSRNHPSIADAEANGVKITGDVQLYGEEASWPNFLVTGSNGKTTATTLLGDIMRAAGKNVFVGGNIGTPVLDALLDGETYSCAVLELSSFQLELIDGLPATAAVVLNVTPDHMDRYATFADYQDAKSQVYAGAERCVYWRDDPCLDGYLNPVSDDISFGLNFPKGERDYGLLGSESQFVCRGKTRLLAVSEIAIRGQHNILNLMACWAMAHQAGVDDGVIANVARMFSGLRHRMQVVGEWAGVTWINDSKATNVAATAAALDGLSSPTVLLAGGQGKGGDFERLNYVLSLSSVKLVILFGADSELIAQHIVAVDTVVLASLEEAVVLAETSVNIGDTVMLSPACASLDMFSSYEDRGNQYIRAVEHINAGAPK